MFCFSYESWVNLDETRVHEQIESLEILGLLKNHLKILTHCDGDIDNSMKLSGNFYCNW